MCSDCNIPLVEELPKKEIHERLVKIEGFGNHEEIRKTVIGIALLYNSITGFLSLISKMLVFIVQGNYKITLFPFLQRNTFWVIVVLGIIIILSIYTNKLGQKYFDILQNKFICLITGILVTIQGLISFSSDVPISIISIQTTVNAYNRALLHSRINLEKFPLTIILANTIPIVIILFQIFSGVYFVKINSKKTVNRI